MSEGVKKAGLRAGADDQHGPCIREKCTQYHTLKLRCPHYDDGKCSAITSRQRRDLSRLYDLDDLVLDPELEMAGLVSSLDIVGCS